MPAPGSHRKRRTTERAPMPPLPFTMTLSMPGVTARRLGMVVTAGIAALAITGLALVAGGTAIFTRTRQFLDFGAGVLALVLLTSSVLWGLVATDRLFLEPRHRIIAQGVHRAGAVAGLGFLVLHIWVKVAEQRTTVLAAMLPFLDGSRPLLIGLGTIAGYLFVAVAASGALRSTFVGPRRARQWRALHMSAYGAWGAALVHGLKSGRPAAGWVTLAYVLAVLGVAAVLLLKARAAAGHPVLIAPRGPLAQLPDPRARGELSGPDGPARTRQAVVNDDRTVLQPRADDDFPWFGEPRARLAVKPGQLTDTVRPVRGEPWASAGPAPSRQLPINKEAW